MNSRELESLAFDTEKGYVWIIRYVGTSETSMCPYRVSYFDSFFSEGIPLFDVRTVEEGKRCAEEESGRIFAWWDKP